MISSPKKRCDCKGVKITTIFLCRYDITNQLLTCHSPFVILCLIDDYKAFTILNLGLFAGFS